MLEGGQGFKCLDSDRFIQQNHLRSCTTGHFLLLLREKGSFFLVLSHCVLICQESWPHVLTNMATFLYIGSEVEEGVQGGMVAGQICTSERSLWW